MSNKLKNNNHLNLVDRYNSDLDYRNIDKATEDMRYVYLVCNPLTKLYKIGITNNPKGRFAQIRNASGMDILEMILLELEIGYDENANYIEKYLHNYFKPKRKFGEWFSLNLNDVLSIRDLFYDIEGDMIWDFQFDEHIKTLYEANTPK